MTDKIPEALAVLDELNLRLLNVVEHTTNNLFAEGMTKEIVKLQKARAAFAVAIDALWVSTEHNALYYGESHNTVITGRKALAAVEKLP